MATQRWELLGEHYEREYLTCEETRDLGLRAVTEDGGPVPREEFRGKVFCFANRDDHGGYLVRGTEETGQSAPLTHLPRA